MKNQTFIALTIFVFSTLTLTAQNNSNHFSKFNFSVGAGLVPTFVADGANTSLPPLTFKAGYQISRNFSLNGFVGFAEADSKPGLVSDGKLVYTRNTQFVTALRGEWKKPVNNKLDIYGGGMFGLSHSRIRQYEVATGQEFVRQSGTPTPFDPNASAGKFFYSGFVGGQYFFRKNIGLFLEAGFGVSLLNTGIVVRL